MANLDEKSTIEQAVVLVDTSTSISPASRPQRLAGWRLFAVQTVLCLGLLLSIMESSIVATALVTIGTDFQDFVKSTWAVLSYLLSYMGLAVVFARLSDVTGRRWAVLIAWGLFTVFSLACGFSSSLNQLIAFRALQGIGGSGLYTLTMVVVPEISPPKLFPLMSACMGAVLSVSGVLGPILGGIITETSTWRWVFWLNSPFGLVAIVTILVSWPDNARSLVKERVRLMNVDWLGALLLLAASVLLIFGLQQAGSRSFAWRSGASISVFTLSGALWILSVAWIIYLHRTEVGTGTPRRESIFPLPVLTHGKMAIVIGTTFLNGFAFMLVLIYLPERFQIIQLKPPVKAGVAMLPMLCFTAVGSAVGGLASARKNYTFWTLAIGNAFVLLGCGLLSTSQISFKLPPHEYAYQIFLGFGLGMTFATATIMCALEVRFQDLAVAQGVVNKARVLGGAIGLTAATIIFNNLAESRLTNVLNPEQLKLLFKSPQSAYSFDLDKQIAVRKVFGDSFNMQLRVCTYLAAASLAISLLAYSKHPPDVLSRKSAHDAWLDGSTEDE